MPNVFKKDLLFPELSYQIVGSLFEVDNALGCGHREQIYQRAVAGKLKEKGISFKEQVPAPVLLDGRIIGRNYLDFLIDEKIILEIKQGAGFLKSHFNQVSGYLKALEKSLAILAVFSPQGVKHRRIVNLYRS